MSTLKKTKIIVLNFLLYIISFWIVYYLKKDTFSLTEEYSDYFLIFIISWFSSAVFSGKFIRNRGNNFLPMSRNYLVAFFFFMGFSAFGVRYFSLDGLARSLILGTLFLPFIIELIILKLIFPSKSNQKDFPNLVISLPVLIREFIILSFSVLCYFLVNKIAFVLSEFLLFLIAGIYICWFISALFAGNLSEINYKSNKIKYLWNYVKSYIIFFILSSFILIFVRAELISQQSFLTAVTIYILFSAISQIIVILKSTPIKSDEINLKILKATTYSDYFGNGNGLKKKGKYVFNSDRGLSPLLTQKLYSTYLAKHKKVFDFINKNINLETFNELKSVILKSSDPYNIEVLPENYLEFYLNLHQTNDMRRINNYFIEINKRLVDGGVYISKFEPTRLRYKRFMTVYPYYLAQAFYFIDFIYKRVFPKLPFVKKIYFILTNGRNRAISLAEGLGRLYYCGFEIIDIMEIDNFVYFIAKKVSIPSNDKSPSYGPFFKMKRIGKDGKTIYVYKLRTMHPYSEYLQKFVYENFSLQEGGKFNNDFRITSWGKVFRKLWFDEMPMLINWFKGEMKLVGVRPLSQHYLSLYSEELKTKRMKYKPGLVPPYYADIPKTLEDIMQSELKYLEAYEKSPLVTDIKYFVKAFYNIIIKKARSG